MLRDILSKPTSADEWALALRNVGRADNDAAYLRSKTEELITNPGWQANPSIGYLNAFDVLGGLPDLGLGRRRGSPRRD